VLAALHALVGAHCFASDAGFDGPAFTPTHAQIAATITEVLLRARSDDEGSVVLCSWATSGSGPPAGAVNEEVLPAASAGAAVLDAIGSLTAPGGVLLIVQSVVLTRGETAVRRDVSQSNGELPLVFGPNWFCSSELISLLVRGVAAGNVGA
jgi:hypothetical protein